MLITPDYGMAVDVDDERCIAHPHDSARMLCGRWRHFLPGPMPQRVHQACKRAWNQLHAAEPKGRKAA